MTAPKAAPQTIAQILQQGLFHHRQGEFRPAMERYMEVLRINPEHAETLYYCAVIACAEGQFKEGVEVVRRAIKFGPATAKMYNVLGQALDRLGEPLEAIKAIDQAIALDPNLAAAHGNRASILVDAGGRRRRTRASTARWRSIPPPRPTSSTAARSTRRSDGPPTRSRITTRPSSARRASPAST